MVESMPNIYEEKLVNYISDQITERLLGEGQEFDKLSVKPSRRFFVGTLLPQEQENIWKSIINPSAMGVEFVVNDNFPCELTITISFEVYYRAYPNVDEQKKGSSLFAEEKEEDEDKSDPLVPIFKKEHFKSTASIDIFSEKGISLKKYFQRDFSNLLQKIRSDIMLFRNKGSAVWSTKSLQNEETFNMYLKKRDGSYTPLPWDFDLTLERFSYPGNKLQLRLTLLNNVTGKKRQKHDPTLFNAKISIESNVVLQEFDLGFIKNEYDDYYKPRAKGIGCVAEVTGNVIQAHHIPKVNYLRRYPKSSIEQMSFAFDDLIKKPILLAEALKNKMMEHLARREEKYKSMPDTTVAIKAHLAESIQNFKEEITLVEKSIKILKTDVNALKAFVLMNRVMKEASSIQGWYVYQIVFILSSLGSFISKSENDKVEVLKVPTGGGKTFCYLGLVIFAAFYERLKGKTFGLTAWIKFPLRMLSLQQLEIVANFICYANKIKIEENIAGDDISIGYFVGSKNTPNKVTDAFEKISVGDVDFRILSKCPFCSNEVNIIPDGSKRRVYHQCSNGHRLPITVVDYELYRVLPTVIISTLDKVTAFNFNHRGKTLLGGDVKVCTIGYGYNGTKWCLNGDEQFLERKKENCGFYGEDGSCLVNITKGYPPSLLIQDEMHMLREDFGCLDALYETLLDDIIYEMSGSNLKVISATATISGINNQVRNLYDRTPRIFPTVFIDEDFYFETSKDLHRVIIGIMPHARAVGYSVYQVIFEYQKELQKILANIDSISEELEVSPEGLRKVILEKYVTSVAYYRSKREAAELSEGVKGIVNEYLKRDNLAELKESDIEIITGEKHLGDLRKLMDRIETTNLNDKIKLIGATMAISHGIDFDELNMMVFQSMPRSISEYIQAMSRVGRKYPALIFVVFHGTRARDNSYYKYFNVLHEQIEKLIEVVPLSRWPKNAIKMMTPGAILAVLHTLFANKKYQNKKDSTKQEQSNYYWVKELQWALKDGRITNDELCRIIEDGFKVEHAPTKEYVAYFKESIKTIIDEFLDYAKRVASPNDSISDAMVKKYEDAPIWSFRGVDDQIDVTPTSDSAFIEFSLDREKTAIEPTGEEKKMLPEEQKEDIRDEGRE